MMGEWGEDRTWCGRGGSRRAGSGGSEGGKFGGREMETAAGVNSSLNCMDGCERLLVGTGSKAQGSLGGRRRRKRRSAETDH